MSLEHVRTMKASASLGFFPGGFSRTGTQYVHSTHAVQQTLLEVSAPCPSIAVPFVELDAGPLATPECNAATRVLVPVQGREGGHGDQENRQGRLRPAPAEPAAPPRPCSPIPPPSSRSHAVSTPRPVHKRWIASTHPLAQMAHGEMAIARTGKLWGCANGLALPVFWSHVEVTVGVSAGKMEQLRAV